MLLIMFCARYYFQAKAHKVLSSHYHQDEESSNRFVTCVEKAKQ